MTRLLALITALVIVQPFISNDAHAAFITIVPEVEAKVDEGAQELSIKAVMRNEGDEAAREIRIEFSEIDRSFVLADELKPGASVEWTGKLPLADLKIAGTGQYALPYRVLYRDLNYYPFSAPYLIVFDRGAAPGRGTVTSFNGQLAAPTVELGSKTSLDLEIKSIAPSALRIDDVRVYTATEIAARIAGETGVELKKGETVNYSAHLENSGALIGSSYAAQVVVRGERDGKHFADITGFQIGIVDSRISPITFLAIALTISGAFVLWYAVRKRAPRATC